MRMPVASKMALAMAGMTHGVPSSPTPLGYTSDSGQLFNAALGFGWDAPIATDEGDQAVPKIQQIRATG